MKGSYIKSYTTRFKNLALLFPTMVSPESKKVKCYIWGLAPQIKWMFLSSIPTTYHSSKHLALQFTKNEEEQGTMVAKVETPKVNNHNKWKFNNGNQWQQKKQRTKKVYAIAPTPVMAQQKVYSGNKLMCNKCKRHHFKESFHCSKFNKKGHIACYCKNPSMVNTIQNKKIGTSSEGHVTNNLIRDWSYMRGVFKQGAMVNTPELVLVFLFWIVFTIP